MHNDQTLTLCGVEFRVGDKQVDTPDGPGAIVDFDRARLRIGVQLDTGEIRYYPWHEVEL